MATSTIMTICQFYLLVEAAISSRPSRKAGESTPVANLYLSMLDAMNVPTEELGDSQGRLNYLTEIS